MAEAGSEGEPDGIVALVDRRIRERRTAAAANIFWLLRLTASLPLGEEEALLIRTIKAAMPDASGAAIEDACVRESCR